MKPETRTVTHLFGLDVRYVVPLYQRPYVWDEEKQWDPLWDDIVTLLDHQEGGNGQLYSHFLGAVVLDHSTPLPGEVPEFTVIDGQQRLTTLQIILAAAALTCAELGAANESDILRELVQNNPKKVSGINLFKVWPTNANRAAFEAVVSEGGPPAEREDDPNNRIDEAHEFFRRKIREWALEAEIDDRQTRLRLLRVTLCDLLKVVSITLETDDNAQVIFETLNARGAPLLALDLVKNAVFLEAARQGLETDQLYEAVWKPEFDDPDDDEYWRAERRQGRLNRPIGELFLTHWLTMKLRRVVPATELFSTFRSNILSSAPAPLMAELIPEIRRDAHTMRSFDDQEPGGVEATFFERLETLDTATPLPLVLFLFREPALSVERRRRALRMLESWLVRRMLMGLTAKDYNKQIPVMIARTAESPERADEILLEELRTGIGQISRWPSDDELRNVLLTRYLYGYIAQARIVMILRAVEMSLYTNKVEAVSVPKQLSIEHVVPQAWIQNWPLQTILSPTEREEAEARRNARLHFIGNLTLVTQPLNAALSNAAWPAKQKELNRHSKLLLNARLIDEFPDVFDEDAIERRGGWLAERIVSIWPGADSWVGAGEPEPEPRGA
jgi:Protein of unknown function DUF262/Protein of unknown function (DUF1524)